VIAVNWFAGVLECGMDTSYCAKSTSKNTIYAGRLEDTSGKEGVPYRNAEFLVNFESRRGEPPVAFHTDSAGRFCVLWADEVITPSPYRPDGGPLFVPGPEGPGGLRRTRDAHPVGVPPHCEEGSQEIPWNRAVGLEDRWQYWLMMALPLLAMAAGAAAIFARRSRFSPRWLAVGTAALGADVIAFFVLRGSGGG